MRTATIFILFIIFCSHGMAQIIRGVDEVTPYHEDLAAIKKGNQWAFINKEGLKVIDFRDDLVSTIDEHFLDENGISPVSYPLFKEGRCLINKLIDGVYYYGYIDNNGKEIIAPQYVNATNFTNGYAIIIKFATIVLGENEALDKRVVSYKLEEYVIDTSGKLIKYLDNARNSIPSNLKNNIPPKFESKFIAPHLIAVKAKDQKWDIYEF